MTTPENDNVAYLRELGLVVLEAKSTTTTENYAFAGTREALARFGMVMASPGRMLVDDAEPDEDGFIYMRTIMTRNGLTVKLLDAEKFRAKRLKQAA